MNFSEFLLESEFRFEGRTAGIITAFNPQGKKLSPQKNKELNRELEIDLRAEKYDPWAIKGEYAGHKEDSFLVPNISREKLIHYGIKYKQKAIIWAKKVQKGYNVEWIEGHETKKKGNVTNIRSLIKKSK